jgi:hypothetical protein
MKTPQPTPKRPVGRPRRADLDELEKELGVTRRRVRQILSETKGGATAPDTALGRARLTKTLLEIERLQILLENEQLEQRRLKGELLYRSEAVELVTAPQQAIATVIRDFGKAMAVRLAGQPAGAIERTLNKWAGELMCSADSAVLKVAGTLKL